jgi:hypothetical protein
VLCQLPEDDDEVARLSTDTDIDIPEIEEPPVVVVPQDNRGRNNGIGNGVQAAPGNSDVTNGDRADGNDSSNGVVGSTSGDARNGRPAGNNGNGNGNGNGNNS